MKTVTYRGSRKLLVVEDDEVHVLRPGAKVNLMYPERVTNKRGEPIFAEDLEPQPEDLQRRLLAVEVKLKIKPPSEADQI